MCQGLQSLFLSCVCRLSIFYPFFFILTPSGRLYPAFSHPSSPSAAPGVDIKTSFCFVLTLPLLVWIFGQVFRLPQSKADEDYLL